MAGECNVLLEAVGGVFLMPPVDSREKGMKERGVHTR